MADLSITAANVVATAGEVTTRNVTAGATVTAGQTVYLDSSDSNHAKLADANDTAAKADVTGIALNGAADGQPLQIATGGELDLGATLTVGKIYVQSTTAGGIAPVDDLASSSYVTVIGVADAADNILLIMKTSGVQVP